MDLLYKIFLGFFCDIEDDNGSYLGFIIKHNREGEGRGMVWYLSLILHDSASKKATHHQATHFAQLKVFLVLLPLQIHHTLVILVYQRSHSFIRGEGGGRGGKFNSSANTTHLSA